MSTAIASSESVKVHFNTVRIRGVDVFYREAGEKMSPVLLLLHAFPLPQTCSAISCRGSPSRFA